MYVRNNLPINDSFLITLRIEIFILAKIIQRTFSTSVLRADTSSHVAIYKRNVFSRFY